MSKGGKDGATCCQLAPVTNFQPGISHPQAQVRSKDLQHRFLWVKIDIGNFGSWQAFSRDQFLCWTDSGIAEMNQISMIVLILLFSSGIFGVEISPKDSEDCPASSEDQRTLLSIVWSCLATIFACTWLSIHPNVPGRNITTRGPIASAIEHVKIMVTTILAPEVIVTWAVEQFIVVWKVCYRTDISISSVINSWRGKKDKYSPNLTMAHGFVLSMGGFYYRCDLSSDAPLSILVLDDLDSLPHLAKKLEEVSAEIIEDKSKGDALSKTFSILQISWFIVQCVARAVQHFPITLLEVTALAFAGLSIITYCLWWNKPLNMKYHISLDGSDSRTFQLTPKTEYVCLPWIMQVEDGFRGFFLGILRIAMGRSDDDHGDVIGRGAFRFSSGSDRELTRFLILFGVGLLFGLFHCAAWFFSFPSHTEMVLWRFSSLVMFIGLYAAGLMPLMAIISRIMLIILALMQLRSLPPLAFHTVEWTTYIPHI
ncbi:hypothetical protein ARMSODRAFT_1007166 [Armillaria solidipes]|uniref:Uncharacterized protein n=1 Tax=Armillaria solidipes TaxID=1076256 RepID=A0A2H3BIB6_9AGAR|nr:hypothetical protein ARMSODRAFT_1007166 [Armillaria solidipes]